MAELVDAHDSKSCTARCEGSSPSFGTTLMQKSCNHCGETYDIAPEDLVFYDAVSPVFGGKKYPIPPPEHCPVCRQQRRLAFRNERNIYSRNCDLCGKHMVSVYWPGAGAFPVYCVKCWWSDKWDASQYGIGYDPSNNFLDQWAVLHETVPKLAMQNDDGVESENSEYSYDISRCKNCYRLIGSWYDHDCHYGLNVNNSKNVVDCNTVSIRSELVYESLDSQHLYHCAYLQNCENCHDCFFGYDLKGCSDCFGCFGLRQKRFCIFNEQKTETEYQEMITTIDLGSYSAINEARKRFDEWSLKFPRLFANLQNCEDCEGNNLFNCKAVTGYSVFSAEYGKYIDRSDGPIHCYDMINTGGPQWCLDCVTPDDSYMTLFSIWCWKCKNIILSDNCHSSEHLLGCISMHRKKYCILNKQYSKEEYERLAGPILESLEQYKSWGSLFPIRLSPFGYNETGANEYYPLSKEEVRKNNWKWTDDLPYTTGKETVSMENLPDSITGIPDSLTAEVLACSQCNRNFKIIPQELTFYRQMPAPLPRKCPNCRHLDRFKRKTPTRLWPRKCDKCGKDFNTAYAPGRPEKIYCRGCYMNVIY